METSWNEGEGQRLAMERFAAAEKILHGRTGSWLTLAHKGRDWVAENHPDIAPGFDGLPFTEEK